MTFTNTEDEETVTAYKYLKFQDAMLYSDGTAYVDLINYDVPQCGWLVFDEESFETEKGTEYAGYSSLKLMYNSLCAARKAE